MRRSAKSDEAPEVKHGMQFRVFRMLLEMKYTNNREWLPAYTPHDGKTYKLHVWYRRKNGSGHEMVVVTAIRNGKRFKAYASFNGIPGPTSSEHRRRRDAVDEAARIWWHSFS